MAVLERFSLVLTLVLYLLRFKRKTRDMNSIFANCMAGKKALVVGVANERSLAWSIARFLHQMGAEVGFTYLGESLERRVRPLAESLGSSVVLPLDAQNPASVENAFKKVSDAWGGKMDVLVHSIAFANREDLEGRFVETSRDGFRVALDISAYSLVEMARYAEPMMKAAGGGSILTLSYLGATRAVQNYNVMGVAKAALEACVRYLALDLGPSKIRVNAISAGPVKTLAAAGIRNFRDMLSKAEASSPLRENIEQDDVGALGAFLCSPASIHTTGTTMMVDSGAHILGPSNQPSPNEKAV